MSQGIFLGLISVALILQVVAVVYPQWYTGDGVLFSVKNDDPSVEVVQRDNWHKGRMASQLIYTLVLALVPLCWLGLSRSSFAPCNSVVNMTVLLVALVAVAITVALEHSARKNETDTLSWGRSMQIATAGYILVLIALIVGLYKHRQDNAFGNTLYSWSPLSSALSSM